MKIRKPLLRSGFLIFISFAHLRINAFAHQKKLFFNNLTVRAACFFFLLFEVMVLIDEDKDNA
ncbi:hypothetical protein MUGA111182_05040 [Mucilaginibacter galii]